MATITVTLRASSWQTVTVDYAASDGTAVAGDDFSLVSGTLVFAPGETSQTASLEILNDPFDEPDETVNLLLSNPVNASLGLPHSAQVTIVENDPPPSVQFNSSSYRVDEGVGMATITVTLRASSWQTVTVDYAASDGTAVAGDDFSLASGTLVFAPGETSQTASLEILNDPFDEPDETVNLLLSNPVNAPLGPTSAAQATIVDDDRPSRVGLQIAALHLVTPDAMEVEKGTLVRPRTEAEWVALYETAFVTLTTALRESGAGWTRVRVVWEWIEPNAPEPGQPPDYVWGPYHDVKLGLVAEAGVRLIAMVADAPGWAAAGPSTPIYPDRLDEFARFLTDLVNRYKGPPTYIKHWELFNEPDRSWDGDWGYHGDQYANMLTVAYTAIKAADPAATVLMGGLAYDRFTEYSGPFNRYFPDTVMENGGGAHVDLLNIHYFPDFHAEWERWDPNSEDRRNGWLPAPTCGDLYDSQGTEYEAGGVDIIAKITHFRNRMDACFGVDKPLWVTEMAEHGYPGDPGSLANQSRYVMMGFARGFSAGAENITWFSLDRPPYDPHEQSLLDSDFSPKPAFFTFQTLTAELSGYEYSHDRNECSWGSGGVSCAVEAYVFEDAAQSEKTAAWGSSRLTFEATQVRVVDRWGTETLIVDGGAGDQDGVQNDTVELQLSADPVFVEVTSPRISLD